MVLDVRCRWFHPARPIRGRELLDGAWVSGGPGRTWHGPRGGARHVAPATSRKSHVKDSIPPSRPRQVPRWGRFTDAPGVQAGCKGRSSCSSSVGWVYSPTACPRRIPVGDYTHPTRLVALCRMAQQHARAALQPLPWPGRPGVPRIPGKYAFSVEPSAFLIAPKRVRRAKSCPRPGKWAHPKIRVPPEEFLQ